LNGAPVQYEIPGGWFSDLASIPWFVPKMIARRIDGYGWLEAAIAHDWFCLARPPEYSSTDAADLFEAAMIAADDFDPLPAWKRAIRSARRNLMVAAVRLGGPQW
jgi:hypothetical protein